MLTFEYQKDGIVNVFMDEEGRDLLLSTLNSFKKPGDHDHLMTPSWSGWELDEERHNEANLLIHQVNIGLTRL